MPQRHVGISLNIVLGVGWESDRMMMKYKKYMSISIPKRTKPCMTLGCGIRVADAR